MLLLLQELVLEFEPQVVRTFDIICKDEHKMESTAESAYKSSVGRRNSKRVDEIRERTEGF